MGQRSNRQVLEQPSLPVQDVWDIVPNALDPEDKNRQRPPLRRTVAPSGVIVIYDDEVPPDPGTVCVLLAPPLQIGAPSEVCVTLAGSGSRSAAITGTSKLHYTPVNARTPVTFSRYRHVFLTDRAIGVLHCFPVQRMVTS